MKIHWNVTNLRFVPTKDLPQQTFVLFVQGPPTVLGWGTIVHTAQNDTQLYIKKSVWKKIDKKKVKTKKFWMATGLLKNQPNRLLARLDRAILLSL